MKSRRVNHVLGIAGHDGCSGSSRFRVAVVAWESARDREAIRGLSGGKALAMSNSIIDPDNGLGESFHSAVVFDGWKMVDCAAGYIRFDELVH